MASETGLSTTAKKNIETIVLVEQALLRRQSRVERLGSEIARFFGSLRFIIAHLCFIVGWVAFNRGWIAGLPPFDPYPFPFLSFLVGIEFIFLTTFVLMNQNYQLRHTEHWEHLNLQLSMLAEQEITKNMEMLQSICKQLGIGNPAQDLAVKELVQQTPVVTLVAELDRAREAGETLAEEIENIQDLQQVLVEASKEVRAESEELNPQPVETA